jgi:hypothetical protein
MILIPKYKDLILPLEIPKTRLAGMYKIEAIGLDGRKRVLADWFPNLITTNGGELIATTGGALSWCAVGSGNATPALGNTTLQTFVAGTSNIVSQTTTAQSSAPYYSTFTATYRFATGTAAGNLSEVGVGPNTSGTNLFSRALILDSVGSPTTITVLSTEVLDVTYQIRNYVPTADVTGSVTIASVSYAYTLRAQNATNSNWAYTGTNTLSSTPQSVVYNGSIAAVTGSPSGATGGGPNGTYSSYSAGSRTAVANYAFAITDGNVAGGISAISFIFNGMAYYQVGVSPSIPKDSTKTMTLSASTSWNINVP